jgi:glucose dehydrogenase
VSSLVRTIRPFNWLSPLVLHGVSTQVSCYPWPVQTSSVFQTNSVHYPLYHIELDPIKKTYSTAPMYKYPQSRDTPAGLVQPMGQGEQMPWYGVRRSSSQPLRQHRPIVAAPLGRHGHWFSPWHQDIAISDFSWSPASAIL